MTTFGDHVYSAAGLLTPYGIPATFGTTYFVDADKGSDGFNGLSMTDTGGSGPKKTVLAAYNATTSNKHDVIVLTGVGAHVISTTLAVTNNRVHFVGLGLGSRYFGQRTRFEMGVTTGGETSLMRVTGTGCTFSNIKFRSVDTNSSYAVEDGGEFTQFTNCSFEHGALLSTGSTAEFLCNADSGYYYRCTFGSNAYTTAGARQHVLFTRNIITGKFARDIVFEDCFFKSRTSVTTSVNLRATLNDIERMCYMKNCMFWTSGDSTATQALVCGIASGLARAQILLHGCVVQSIDNVAASGLGVFTSSPQAVDNATESVSVNTS